MPVTPAEVDRIAALARLSLSPEERVSLAGELGSILAHLDVLRRADLTLAPEPDAVATAPLRPDQVSFDPLLRPLAELAPDWSDGLILVPRLPAVGDAGQ